MTDPPSPKRQRTDDKPAATEEATQKELEQIQKVIESVEKVEEELEKENEQQAKEILAIETKYNAKKRPTYVKRAKLLTEIPNFWKQVVRMLSGLVNHPLVGNCMDDSDEIILGFLEALDVTFVDENGGFKLEMVNAASHAQDAFAVKFSDDDEVDVTASEIDWKTSDEAKELSGKCPFFEVRFAWLWFTATDGDQDIADIIKDDLWKNPVQFYMMDEDEDEDEDEEGDEVEEEEGEGDEDEGDEGGNDEAEGGEE
ncbi:hypothetical protein BBJ28_00011372 [Nothophytophthora sp. Chile5]|nr:hypothetical protein BBJ28_00011372 [Nothophytophthora sp. Chile5]